MKRWLPLLCALAVLATIRVEGQTPEPREAPAPGADPTADPGAPGDRPAPAPRELTAEDEARRARVYARVGEATVTVGDIEDAIAAQSPFLRARYQDREKLQELAQSLVRFELLAREAARRDYDENAAVVRSRKQNAVQQLIRREFDDRITPESITDEQIQAYYEAHEDEFRRPEMVRVSHIQFLTREAALEVLEQARAADARTFRTLAREHSTDTETKLRGGDLRYFDREGRIQGARNDDRRVASGLVEAAFALETLGEVTTEPVEVDGKWSIVKLTGRRAAEERSLEQAGQGIRIRLWRETRQEAIDDFVSDLRQAASPVVHDERMRNIRLAPIQAAAGLPRHPPVGESEEATEPEEAEEAE